MEKSDPDYIAGCAKSLLMCTGWKAWLKPLMEARVKAIETELVNDLPEETTKDLRKERVILKQWMEKPDATLKGLNKAATTPERSGAATP